MGDILEKIKEKGYTICKGYTFGDKIYTNGCEDKRSLNYGKLCIINPKGKKETIVGKLDTDIYIGDKTLKTSRRELIELIYKPDEDGWCYLNNHYGLRTKEFIQRVYDDIHLLTAKSFEVGGSDDKSVENSSTTEFEAYYFNGSADISLVDDKYVVQIYTQADIDVFMCYQFTFACKPSIENVHTAMDIFQFPMVFLKGIDEYKNDIHWLDREEAKAVILSEYSNLKKYG